MSHLSSTPYKQRGDILLESLIGIVLMAIVGLGLVYSASRVAVSQKDMNQQNIVVSQMREALQSKQARAALGCSGNASLGNVTATVKCHTSSVSIGGTTHSISSMSLKFNDGTCIREPGGVDCN